MLGAKMANFRTNRTFDTLFILVLVVFLGWATLNRVAIGDAIFFARYTPNAKTQQVALGAGLTPVGRRLLYRTDPQFDTLEQVNAACDIERLGCLSSNGQTFILDDPTKPNQTIVTAAHEMLHLAYRRLPQDKKDELAPLLDQAIAQNAINTDINAELSDLKTPDDRRDEAHSLLGTEYQYIPPALESYYATYFSDRSKVLAAAASKN